MNNIIALLLMVCVIKITHATLPYGCNGPNMEMISCPNAGIPSCLNPFESRVKGMCESLGCQCKTGYIWNKKSCIKPEKCPKPICTGLNEVYMECYDPCPDRCEYLSGLVPRPLCALAWPCKAGCNCRPDYLRNKEGVCVAKSDCPPSLVCKENEVVNECPGPCVPGEMSYCSEYLSDTPLECDPPADLPCEPRCDCVEGYLRNSQGICVKKENSLVCGIGERLNPCKGYCYRQPSCATLVKGLALANCPPPPPDYDDTCVPVCECLPDLIRIDGVCQSPNKCCDDPFSEVVDCPTSCEETCNGPPPPDCKKSECFNKTCKCIAGYVKDANDKCIPRNKCPPKLTCKGANEEYQKCGTACPPTCAKRNPICKASCQPGCFCKKGFIREKAGGRCIKPTMCSY